MEQKTHRRIELVCIVALLVIMLPSADYLTKRAFAVSLSFFDNSADASGATGSEAIARIGSKIAISDTVSNTVTFRSATNPNDMIGQIAVGADIYQLAPNSGSTRLYGVGDTLLYEFDIDLYSTLRTVAHTCATAVTEGVYFDSANNNVYCVQTDEEIVRISMNSMSITFTSSTMNAGATPCVVSQDIQYESATDTMFATCTTTSRLVAIEGFTTSGTPDLSVVPSGTPEDLAFNTNSNNILVCKTSGQPQAFDYIPATSLTLNQALDTTSETCLNSPTNSLVYHSQSDRYLYFTSNDKLIVRDGTNFASLFSTSWTGGGAETQLYVFSNTFAYLANVVDTAGTDYAIFDMTGLALGTGGQDEGDGEVGDIDGDGIPDNQDTDMDGDGIPNSQDGDIDGDGIPNSQDDEPCGSSGCNVNGICVYGTVLQCTSGSNSFSGFSSGRNVTDIVAGVTDGLGFTDCGTENPDHETCGSGLFLFLIVLLIVEFMVLAGYLGFTTKLHADKQIVDVALIMAIAGFVVLALGFYLNWIPDLVFYSMIVIVAGFLVFGLIQRIKGG